MFMFMCIYEILILACDDSTQKRSDMNVTYDVKRSDDPFPLLLCFIYASSMHEFLFCRSITLVFPFVTVFLLLNSTTAEHIYLHLVTYSAEATPKSIHWFL